MSGFSAVLRNTAGVAGGGIFLDGGSLIHCFAGLNVAANQPDNINR